MQLVTFCLLFALSTLAVRAEPPTIEALFPSGAARGSTNALTVSGKYNPWPPKVWASAAQPGFKWSRSGPLTEAGDIHVTAETNKGKLTVIVAPDAAPGPRIVRLHNDEGASEPRFFIVGQREIIEAETNNHFAEAQVIDTLPATVNGRLAKGGDVDSYAVRLQAGEEVEVRVASYTLMSKLDAVLRVVDTNGQQLAWNHDFSSLDPRLLWRADDDQTVVVQVFGFPHPATSDIRLYGGDSAFYRLHLRLAENIPRITPTKTPRQLAVPSTVQGCIKSKAAEERFEFTAAKDEMIEMRVIAAAIGSPLDAWLAVLDAEGKELTRSDDANNSRDPLIEWKAPAAGTYTAVVGSLTHRGGDDYNYALEMKPVAADFEVSLSTGAMVLTGGATNALKFKVKRLRGHSNELTARVAGLPSGVTGAFTNIPLKGSDFEISLVAKTDAARFSGPIHLFVTDEATREERVALLSLTSRSEDNGVPGGYSELLIDSIDHCWLTVRSKPDEPPKTAAAK